MADKYGNPSTHDEYVAEIEKSGLRYELVRVDDETSRIRVLLGDRLARSCTTPHPVQMSTIWGLVAETVAKIGAVREGR